MLWLNSLRNPKKLANFITYRALIPVLLVALLCGCSTYQTVRAANRARLTKLSIGMSKPDVLQIMGTKTIRIEGILYPADRITNPFRSESLIDKDGMSIEVLYYYTDQKSTYTREPLSGTPLAIVDDELTPIVFHDGKLIGWGWRALEDVKAKYEIRMR